MEYAMWREFEAGNFLVAASIAKDCAPYKHPRLAAIQHSGRIGAARVVNNHLALTIINDPNAADLACQLLERMGSGACDASGVGELGHVQDVDALPPPAPAEQGSA
jgi:hypothetical protein